jgi:hypothetical protein
MQNDMEITTAARKRRKVADSSPGEVAAKSLWSAAAKLPLSAAGFGVRQLAAAFPVPEACFRQPKLWQATALQNL